MAVNLCIDIGNSRIKMAVFENASLKHFEKFEHNKDSEIFKWLEGKEFTAGIYSSVLKIIPYWLINLSGEHKIIKLSQNMKLPLTIHYQTPESLGTDRIAAMVGAISLFPNDNLLIVNAGTCITYDLVNQKQEFIGGNIAPGLEMRWKAMHEFTSSLPKVNDINPESGFLGNSTLSALQNGGLQGIVLEIEGYFTRLNQKHSDLKCIISGGSVPFLVNHLKIGNFAEPYLVLKGLNTILNYQ